MKTDNSIKISPSVSLDDSSESTMEYSSYLSKTIISISVSTKENPWAAKFNKTQFLKTLTLAYKYLEDAGHYQTDQMFYESLKETFISN